MSEHGQEKEDVAFAEVGMPQIVQKNQNDAVELEPDRLCILQIPVEPAHIAEPLVVEPEAVKQALDLGV